MTIRQPVPYAALLPANPMPRVSRAASRTSRLLGPLLGLAALLLTPAAAVGQTQVFDFAGIISPLTIEYTLPFTEEVYSRSGDVSQNALQYIGGSGTDFIFFTNFPSALFIREGDQQVVVDVERFIAGDNADVLLLDDPVFTLPDITLSGGAGGDLLVANRGDDIVTAGEGADFVYGAGGNDNLSGDGDR